VWETALKVLAALGAPALGLAIRASRGNRLLARIHSYVQLAKELDRFDPESAAEVRDLAKQTARQLVEAERASLARRFDPAAVFATLLVLVPGAALFAWSVTVDEWWKWPLICAAVGWALVVTVAGWQSAWRPHDPDEQPAGAA
jgi:hypothetical protein